MTIFVAESAGDSCAFIRTITYHVAVSLLLVAMRKVHVNMDNWQHRINNKCDLFHM